VDSYVDRKHSRIWSAKKVKPSGPAEAGDGVGDRASAERATSVVEGGPAAAGASTASAKGAHGAASGDDAGDAVGV